MKKFLSILLIVTALLITACASSNNIYKTANETVKDESKNNTSNKFYI